MEKTSHLVISDTHGDTEAFRKVTEKALALGAEAILSAGDLCPQSAELQSLLINAPVEIIQVRGNCDSLCYYDNPYLKYPPLIISRKLGERYIELTHGDRIWEPEALSEGDIFITGHTHVPALYTDEEGIIHLNPGSISRPRNREGASYAIITDRGIELRLLNGDTLLEELLFKALKPEA